MIIPFRQDEDLLTNILHARILPGEFRLWWLGQSGFLIKTASTCILIDPYLSDSLTTKYAGTAKPHIRLTQLCLDPTRLGFVDLVFSSHGHTDHFDRETLRAIASAPGRKGPLSLVLPVANVARARDMLGDLGPLLLPVDVGGTLESHGIHVTAVPAAHTAIEHDARGNHLYLGYVLKIGNHGLYHSGDTVWEESVLAAVRALRPEVVLLPINGHDSARGVAGNLNGEEAARFAGAVGASLAIPHHYDLFGFNTASPEPFAAACRQLGIPQALLPCGGSWDSHSRDFP